MAADRICQDETFERADDVAPLAYLTASPLLDLPYILAKKYGFVIQHLGEGRLAIALRYDADPAILIEISHIVTLAMDLEFVNDARFNSYLSKHYANEDLSDFSVSTNDQTKEGNLAKVGHLIDAIIFDAFEQGASDIHIEANDIHLIIRIRSDGKLLERFRLSAEFSRALLRRLVKQSEIDEGPSSEPQKSKIILMSGDKPMEISISAMLGKQCERVVLRISDIVKTGVKLELQGMAPEMLSRLRQAITEPGGMIIVTGPLDSGKAMTLHAILNQLNDGNRSIITIENFVEQYIDGIHQIDIEKSNNLSVTNALRSMLLQDPDVIMLSELNDRKAAEIAIQAALAGPLVLTALHASDAVGVISMLRKLKVDNALLSESLRAVIAQRLVKRLCGACRVPVQAADSIASRLGFDRGAGVFRPNGCAKCDHSGYIGSVGVFELVFIDDTLRRLIKSGGDEAVISSHAFLNNPNLSSAARRLVISGETTAEEAIRIGYPSFTHSLHKMDFKTSK
jgi:general secretion pathway protein E